jgi:putative membrane protein (TIGR04086 family)
MEISEGVKAVLIAIICALVLTSAFALIMQVAALSNKVILPVNLTIKAVSVFVGCVCALRGQRGWLRGLAVGLAFTCLSGLLFALVGGEFSFTWLLIVEVLFGAVIGALSGMFSVNLR